jgi:hypothetical protein
MCGSSCIFSLSVYWLLQILSYPHFLPWTFWRVHSVLLDRILPHYLFEKNWRKKLIMLFFSKLQQFLTFISKDNAIKMLTDISLEIFNFPLPYVKGTEA